MNPTEAFEMILLAICVWREARGEVVAAKYGVAWTVRNRALNPGWWGNGWVACILKPFQYSSFNPTDPNAVKWPAPADPSWVSSLQVADEVYQGGLDPTSGCTHYFDRSLDSTPPTWAKDGSMVEVIMIGNLRFWKADTR